jgi:trimeric autotransporter adhesin
MSARRLSLGSLALVAILAACSSSGGPTVQTTVSIGADQTVAKGLTHAFTAQLSRTDGSSRDCTADAVWTSLDETVASVAGGVATGVGQGATTITATCEGIAATAGLTVTAAALVRVDVASAESSLPVGLAAPLTATGTYTDGATADLTAAVTWSSSADGVLTVSNDPVSAGLATAIATGTATVRAEAAGGIAGTLDVTVIDVQLVTVTVAPVAPLPLGLGAALVATGTYTDAGTRDVTESVTWSSSSPAVLAVSDVAGSRGAALAVSTGTATVTASAAGVSGSTDVTVTSAEVLIVDVAPTDPALPVGTVLPLYATATYTDDTVADLTPAVTWTSSDPLVVEVAASGVATARAVGTAVVTATYPVSGVSGTTAVTVVAANVPAALSYLSLSRGAILGGGTVTATVVLTAASASPIEVTLATNGPNATVPVTVTVPAGATRATFPVSTTTPTRKKVRVTISANYDGVTKVANLNVRR